jgi:hypothetical protein
MNDNDELESMWKDALLLQLGQYLSGFKKIEENNTNR